MPAEHKGTAKPPAMHPFVLVCSCHALRMVLACNVVCLWLFFFSRAFGEDVNASQGWLSMDSCGKERWLSLPTALIQT